jgi:hypothetical protein
MSPKTIWTSLFNPAERIMTWVIVKEVGGDESLLNLDHVAKIDKLPIGTRKKLGSRIYTTLALEGGASHFIDSELEWEHICQLLLAHQTRR